MNIFAQRLIYYKAIIDRFFQNPSWISRGKEILIEKNDRRVFRKLPEIGVSGCREVCMS